MRSCIVVAKPCGRCVGGRISYMRTDLLHEAPDVTMFCSAGVFLLPLRARGGGGLFLLIPQEARHGSEGIYRLR